MAQDPKELAGAVRAHADAVFGTAGRAVEKAAGYGQDALDLIDRGAKAAKRLLDRVDGKDGPKRTTDIRLPNEPRKGKKGKR